MDGIASIRTGNSEGAVEGEETKKNAGPSRNFYPRQCMNSVGMEPGLRTLLSLERMFRLREVIFGVGEGITSESVFRRNVNRVLEGHFTYELVPVRL